MAASAGCGADVSAVVADEEAWLSRALEAIRRDASKRAAADDSRRARGRLAGADPERDVVRALRDEAATAQADDMPQLLHELAVRQRNAHVPAAAVVDSEAPYFGHLRVREGEAIKDYLLGAATLIDPAANVRIVDWRVAPVASVFYEHREGDDYDLELPERVVEGTVLARRIVGIERGRLCHILTDKETYERVEGGWRVDPRTTLKTGGAKTATRPGGLASSDVTALLDAEQYAAITAPPDEALVVTGSAGSGKTTVALHRLARLRGSAPERFSPERLHVVVPEEGLARLSRRLLQPLSPGIAVSTVDDWAVVLARRTFGELPRVVFDAPGLVVSLKRHPATFDLVREELKGGQSGGHGGKLRVLRARLGVLFSDRAFLTEIVKRGGLSLASVETTVRHTMLQLADPISKQLRDIVVPELRRAVDGRSIEGGTPDELAGSVDVEDLPLLLLAHTLHHGRLDSGVAHLVVDEAEDVSLTELFVLGKTLSSPPSVTLAGDGAQQTTSSFAGWDRAVEVLGVKRRRLCQLQTSYRCPRPIAELARHILGPLAPDEPILAAKDGPEVGVHRFPREEQAALFLSTVVRDLLASEPHASVAVLARDADAAVAFHRLFAEVPDTRLVLGGEFTFEPGLDVCDVESAKGLEFDYVIVPDATAKAYPTTDEARRRLHVAATRASHQLWMVAGGEGTKLV